ncbi:glucosaminidase domain-containing protein [Coprothermobacter platensis]|uniref:glucosaminidase domain-containing protein n=1 Tax=Coprothermobacter platensis TaxID=108819 RepID=UPI000382DB9F|nr:glucosaminidase domain-containing protein [Coprothermobacter platensis]
MWELTPDTKIISSSGISWLQFQRALKGTPMETLGPTFACAETVSGVNAVLLSSVAVLESGWGKSPLSKRTKNLFGFQAYDRNPSGAKVFSSYEEGVFFVADYIKTHYASPGGVFYRDGTLKSMGKLWASDPHWVEKVCSVAATLKRRA